MHAHSEALKKKMVEAVRLESAIRELQNQWKIASYREKKWADKCASYEDLVRIGIGKAKIIFTKLHRTHQHMLQIKRQSELEAGSLSWRRGSRGFTVGGLSNCDLCS